MLPTDPKIRALSPYQTLWLATHIKKEQMEEREYYYNLAKMVCSVINPTVAVKAFKEPDEEEFVENENFEQDLKALDPEFNMDSVKDYLGD